MASTADFEINAGLNIDDASLNAAAKKVHAAISNAIKNAGMGVPSNLPSMVAYASQPTSTGSVAALSHLEKVLRTAERSALKNGDSAAATVAGAGAETMRLEKNYARRKLNQSVNYKTARDKFTKGLAQLDVAYASGNREFIKDTKAQALSAARTVLGIDFQGIRSDEDTKKASDALRELTKATKINSAAMLAFTSGVTASIGFVGQALPSYWGQMATRNVFSTQAAYNERLKSGGQAAGGVIGGVLGAAVGGALTGGMGGQIVGAQIGSSIGNLAGGLLGEHGKAEFESQKRTINDVQTRYKALGLYRGAYSPTFGMAVGELGQATAGDVENMVGNSQTLAARMMFGQVGDNEMLLYSLMPNYFAAAMAGASDAELAAAYQRDLMALDPSLRLWVGSMVGGGSPGMVAFAQDRYSSGVLAQGGFYHGTDHIMIGYGSGYQSESVNRGVKNAITLKNQAMADMTKAAQLEAAGQASGIYSRQGSIPMWLEIDGKMVATNSKEYDDFVAAGGVNERGNPIRALVQRQARFLGVSDKAINTVFGGVDGTKESMSIEAFERAARKAERSDVPAAESLDEEMEWRRRHVTQIVLNNIVEGGTTTQKIIDIMGDEAAVSNEISRFNLGH